MSSETRRAETDALLAKIEDVVTGHELQRSYEGAPGDFERLQREQRSIQLTVVVRVGELRRAMTAFAELIVNVLQSPAWQELMTQLDRMAEAANRARVPAKASARRRYQRRRR